ncbi:MAG: hypothetical protein II215_04045 [Paludibacteraceae bacterium]|jgi:hypothetical protein|nr:hypothetical protein [Paludibacteraceae bacterium]MED9995871.1 hypothetical protein [Paludibacteraceae bacterium]
MEEFFLNIVYKNKRVKFRIANPEAPLSTLMSNLRHATGSDGRLIFDFPSIDQTGAPMDYFFGKEDTVVNEVRILRPRLGKVDQTLADYNIENGETVFVVPDPFPG